MPLVEGIYISPNGTLGASVGQSGFAGDGGGFLKIHFIDPQLRYEDQLYQEFGAFEARFADTMALSNTDVAATSRRAVDVPAQLHIFTRTGGGIWSRSTPFELTDGFSVSGFQSDLAISEGWLAAISINESKVRFYKKQADGWKFSSELRPKLQDIFKGSYDRRLSCYQCIE